MHDMGTSFNTRLEFLRYSHALLSSGGVIALADLVPLNPSPSILLRLLYLVASVPRSNMLTLSQRREQLAKLGFTDIEAIPITASVLLPLSSFLVHRADDDDALRQILRPGVLNSYRMFGQILGFFRAELGFALIVARKP